MSYKDGRRNIRIHIIKEGCQNCKLTAKQYGMLVVMIPCRLGFGDVVRDIIHALTHIKPCAGCERRRRWLNKHFPFIGPVMTHLLETSPQVTFPIDVEVDVDMLRALVSEMGLDRSVLNDTPWELSQ